MIIYTIYIFFLEKYYASLTPCVMCGIITLRSCVEVREISLFIITAVGNPSTAVFLQKEVGKA